jgi:hypothetical protein
VTKSFVITTEQFPRTLSTIGGRRRINRTLYEFLTQERIRAPVVSVQYPPARTEPPRFGPPTQFTFSRQTYPQFPVSFTAWLVCESPRELHFKPFTKGGFELENEDERNQRVYRIGCDVNQLVYLNCKLDRVDRPSNKFQGVFFYYRKPITNETQDQWVAESLYFLPLPLLPSCLLEQDQRFIIRTPAQTDIFQEVPLRIWTYCGYENPNIVGSGRSYPIVNPTRRLPFY